MATANFFGRAAQSIGQIIKSAPTSELQELLSHALIEVAYSLDAPSAEVDKALDLLIRLLARLYPRLKISKLGAIDRDGPLRRLARSINPQIEFSDGEPTFSLFLGSERPHRSTPLLSLGADAWTARVSLEASLPFGNSAVPFGAGAAACIGAANAFRHTFASLLPPQSGLDEEAELNLLSYNEPNCGPVESGSIKLGRVHLIGAGAIGNAVVWAFTRSDISSDLIVIDHERVELSNLQRYVLTSQKHVGKSKVDVARLAAKGTRTRVVPRELRWEEFAEADYRLESVLTALDTPEDRIAVQSSLPRWIANAWTQTGDLGVSRHFFVGQQACLACLYWPTRSVPSLDEMVASALRMTDQLMRVREILYGGEPVGAALIYEVAARLGVDSTALMSFADRPLIEFYQQGICGGLVLELADHSTSRDVEVPLVFQSALAGIMLAAEATTHATGTRTDSFPAKTVIDVMRPLPKHSSMRVAKNPSCICSDADFKLAYETKFGTASLSPHPPSLAQQ